MEVDISPRNIFKNLSLFFIFILLGWSFMVYREVVTSNFSSFNLPNFQKCPDPPATEIKKLKQKKNVFIMASYRGGSTLAGEIFNRNSDVLYYFGKLKLSLTISSNLKCPHIFLFEDLVFLVNTS